MTSRESSLNFSYLYSETKRLTTRLDADNKVFLNIETKAKAAVASEKALHEIEKKFTSSVIKAAEIERNTKLRPLLDELARCLNERDSNVNLVLERKIQNIIPALSSLKGQVVHLKAQATELATLMKQIVGLKAKENENWSQIKVSEL